MDSQILALLKEILSARGIPIFCGNPQLFDLKKIDYGIRKLLYQEEENAYQAISDFLLDKVEENHVYFIRDTFFLNYCIFLLPKEISKDTSKEICILGPVSVYKPSCSEFESFLIRNHIPENFKDNLLTILNRVPEIPSSDFWFSFLTPFCHALLKESIELVYLELPFNSNDLAYSDYHVASDPKASMQVLEARYEAEDRMLNAVLVGNTEKAMEYHHQFLQFKLNPRSADPIRDRKNLLFTFNTLLRKTVQSAQVHPLHIDNLSTQFAIQIESLNSASQLSSLSDTMIRKYCLLVKNYSRKAYSPLVQTCLDYIDFHYAEELTLDRLSKLCSVSNPYLSALFKKETNSTLTDYVNSTRIRQSLILLNTTNLLIQEIAEKCGFPDANYFTRIFKKFQGLSPKEYRDIIRKR